MKLIAVVGSGSDSGKTTLVCRILAAIPGLGAVKLSPREEPPRVEWGPGVPGKDTARYQAAGAVKIARIVGPRERAPESWLSCATEFQDLRGVVIEGAGALDCAGERFSIFVVNPEVFGMRPEREARFSLSADAIVAVRSVDPNGGAAREVVKSHLWQKSRLIDLADLGNGSEAFRDLLERLTNFISKR